MQTSSTAAAGDASAETSASLEETAEPSQAAPETQPAAGEEHNSAPSYTELEDLLYDLLSSGPFDPSLGQDKYDAIQSFLHEHARENKTHAQLIAFFEEHGIEMQVPPPNPLAMPQPRSSHIRDMPLNLNWSEGSHQTPQSTQPSYTPPARPAPQAVQPHSRPKRTAVARTSGVHVAPFLWMINISALSALAALLTLACWSVRDELMQLRAYAEHTSRSLSQLRADTDRLRQTLEETQSALQSSERHTQLLLQSLGHSDKTNN